MTHTKEELQAIYFGLYDQLPEPYKSEAKQNWDYDFVSGYVPKNSHDAIRWGFDWTKIGKWNKWNGFYHELLNNEIPLTTTDLPSSIPTLSDIKKQLDRIEELLNKLIEKK